MTRKYSQHHRGFKKNAAPPKTTDMSVPCLMKSISVTSLSSCESYDEDLLPSPKRLSESFCSTDLPGLQSSSSFSMESSSNNSESADFYSPFSSPTDRRDNRTSHPLKNSSAPRPVTPPEDSSKSTRNMHRSSRSEQEIERNSPAPLVREQQPEERENSLSIPSLKHKNASNTNYNRDDDVNFQDLNMDNASELLISSSHKKSMSTRAKPAIVSPDNKWNHHADKIKQARDRRKEPPRRKKSKGCLDSIMASSTQRHHQRRGSLSSDASEDRWDHESTKRQHPGHPDYSPDNRVHKKDVAPSLRRRVADSKESEAAQPRRRRPIEHSTSKGDLASSLRHGRYSETKATSKKTDFAPSSIRRRTTVQYESDTESDCLEMKQHANNMDDEDDDINSINSDDQNPAPIDPLKCDDDNDVPVRRSLLSRKNKRACGKEPASIDRRAQLRRSSRSERSSLRCDRRLSKPLRRTSGSDPGRTGSRRSFSRRSFLSKSKSGSLSSLFTSATSSTSFGARTSFRQSLRRSGSNSQSSMGSFLLRCNRSCSNHSRVNAGGSSNHCRDSGGLSDHGRPVKEMNIFGAEMISTEFILGELEEVKNNPDIVRLEFEDILDRCKSDLARAIKDVLNHDDRPWERVRFVDEVIMDGTRTYRSWLQKKRSFLRHVGNVCTLKLIPVTFSTKLTINSNGYAGNEDDSITMTPDDVVSLLQDAQKDKSVTSLDLTTTQTTEDIVRALTALFECDDRKWASVHLQMTGSGPCQPGSLLQ
jgi:hypothetical protein